MVARTLAVLFIISAVITLGYLAVFPMTRSAAKTASDENGQQPRAIRTPAARVLILGNVITAAVYLVLYGFAAGTFN